MDYRPNLSSADGQQPQHQQWWASPERDRDRDGDAAGLTQPLLSQSPTLRHFLGEVPPTSPVRGSWAGVLGRAPSEAAELAEALDLGGAASEAEYDKETQALLAEIRRADGDPGVTSGLVRQRSEVRRKHRRFASSRADSRQSSGYSSFSSLADVRVPDRDRDRDYNHNPYEQQQQQWQQWQQQVGDGGAGDEWSGGRRRGWWSWCCGGSRDASKRTSSISTSRGGFGTGGGGGGTGKWWAWPARKCSEVKGMAGGPFAFPFKAGLAATVASILCFLPPIYSSIDMNGVWAVVTVDMVLEASVGLTISKGINRTLGTLVAALMALFVNLLAPSWGSYEPYFILACVFLGAAIPTVFKFRRPFKDKWNYAVVMSMITFHLLILSGASAGGGGVPVPADYTDDDPNPTDPATPALLAFAYNVKKLSLPLIRLCTIAIGFLVAALVNLSFAPHFAGDTVNRLVAKNFHTAGTVVDRCVRDYSSGTVLEPVPEVLRKKTPLDNIYTSFYEILAADSEVDKLMKAVPFEPCHGRFVWGFPWDLYADIIDNLRYAIYDVIALDACLRAEIQAPHFVRILFLEELQVIGGQAGIAMRLAGAMLHDMRRYPYLDIIQRAEEAALMLQHKIRKYSRILLADHGPAAVAATTAAISIPDSRGAGGEPNGPAAAATAGAGAPPAASGATSFQSFTLPRSFPEPKSYHPQQDDELALALALGGPGPAPVPVQAASASPRKSGGGAGSAGVHRADWQTELFLKSESLGREWDGTIQRIASLSFVKFSSLLIEMIAKAKSILALVDELGEKANYPRGDRKLTTNVFHQDDV